MKCPKCNGGMEVGSTIEYKSPGGQWNLNTPKNETWGKGINSGFFNDSVKEELPISTYRCKKCGYLESYAK